MTDTNYGIVLKKGSTVVGEITNLKLPKITGGKIETTHAASGGKRTQLPSGLVGMDDFSVTINVTATTLAAFYTDMTGKTVATYSFVFPTGLDIDDWDIDAFIVDIDPGEIDQQNPDVLKAVITLAVADFSDFAIAEVP